MTYSENLCKNFDVPGHSRQVSVVMVMVVPNEKGDFVGGGEFRPMGLRPNSWS